MNLRNSIYKNRLLAMMKNVGNKAVLIVFLFFAGLSIPVQSFAQFSNSNQAAKFYDIYSYAKAAELYEELHNTDKTNQEYVQRLAYCYNKMLNYKKALYYYQLLVKSNISKPIDYYSYAQLLINAGNVTESKVWLAKYLEKVPEDLNAKRQLDDLNQDAQSKIVGADITIKNLDGNTRFIDMAATFYKDQVVYSSARDSFSMIKTTYDWNNQPYLDLYVSKPGLEPNEKDERTIFKSVNSRYHEGPVCFNSDFSIMYFTRNNYFNGHVETTHDGTINLKIFTAEFDGKKWDKVKAFPFNSDLYSVGHPTLSPDGKTLYFVSDMPGGFGQTDIYKTELINGVWSKPVNLGETVNTSGKEMFPYVDKSGVLYFSSDGYTGFGGLDIYAAQSVKTGGYKVVNLGAPLNSTYDDFGLSFNPETLSGYFTSNRPGGKGDDDIYSFTVNKIDLRVICFDDHTKALLPGSKIALLGSNGVVIESKIADTDGAVEFSVKPKEKYQLVAENQTYTAQTKDIQIHGSALDFKQKEDVFLKQGFPYLTLEVIDKESGLIIPNALVDISEGKYDEADLEDSNGIIKMKMNASTDYTFYVSAEGFFDKTVKFSSVGKNVGEYSLTVELEALSTGKQFVLEDLYYDLDKYEIRPDAAVTLDKLAKILQDNQEVRIEIGSHTDSRAAADYNMKLSQKRSEAVVAYLISKGIDKSRLVAKGYGETQLINKCADGVDCPESEHQANRRTVIEILNQDIRKVKRGTKNIYYF